MRAQSIQSTQKGRTSENLFKMKKAISIKAKARIRASASDNFPQESASDVSNDVGDNGHRNLPHRTAAKKDKVNTSSSLARFSISRSRIAGSLDEYASALRRNLRSAGSSVVPMSGRTKSGLGENTSDTMASVDLARLKRARRAFEGGPISEERFREMQSEVYRLKTELADKEEQRKMLVGRLNRADDASKRNLRANLEHLSLPPKQKRSVLSVLTQNYNADKTIQELEGTLRVAQRDNRKYLQYVRSYKAEIEWLKKRSEATVRASRRARSCRPEDISKSYGKIVKNLQKQLISLQEENNCLTSTSEHKSAEVHESVDHSTKDPTSCMEHPGSYEEKAEPPSSLAKMNLDMPAFGTLPQGGNYGQGVLLENVEQIARCSINSQLPSDELHTEGMRTWEIPLKETMVEQSIVDTLSTFDVTSQLMDTWERLKTLTVSYNEAMDELRLLKINHERCLRKLQKTYHDLCQERKTCSKLEAAEKRLALELTVAKQVEVLLQQVRQQNVQLEIENAELVASALNVPRTNFSELKTLRQQLVEELKQRKLAEVEASKLTLQLEDCRHDLARLAVVEGNWTYLKSELVRAKKAVTKANQKVKGLQESNEFLLEEMNMKGINSLQMKLLRNLSQLPALSEEEKEICSNEDRLESNSGSDVLFSDSQSPLDTKEREKVQTPEIGLHTLSEANQLEMQDSLVKSTFLGVEMSPSFPAALSNHISITIVCLELNAFTDLSSIKTICVRFQFLAGFCELDGQCTPSVSNDRAVLHYFYTRAFSVDETAHGDTYDFLKRMIDSEATAYIEFHVFGEELKGKSTKLLGSCQVNLWEAMHQENARDILEKHSEVRSGGANPTDIGTLHVVVQGLELLRGIHAPSWLQTHL